MCLLLVLSLLNFDFSFYFVELLLFLSYPELKFFLIWLNLLFWQYKFIFLLLFQLLIPWRVFFKIFLFKYNMLILFRRRHLLCKLIKLNNILMLDWFIFVTLSKLNRFLFNWHIFLIPFLTDILNCLNLFFIIFWYNLYLFVYSLYCGFLGLLISNRRLKH